MVTVTVRIFRRDDPSASVEDALVASIQSVLTQHDVRLDADGSLRLMFELFDGDEDEGVRAAEALLSQATGDHAWRSAYRVRAVPGHASE